MGFKIGKLAGAIGGGLNLITAGTTMADRLLARSDQKNQMEMQNTYNLQNFNLQKDWEKEKMLNAHQWEMEDLKKAGINPGLTAGDSGAVGSGAPGTTTPTSGTGFGNLGQNFINGLNTLESLEYQKKLVESQSYKNIMSGDKDAIESGLMPTQIQNQTRDSLTNAKQVESQKLVNTALIEKIKSEANLSKLQATGQTLDNSLKEFENSLKTGNFAKAKYYYDSVMNSLQETAKVIGIGVGAFGTYKAVNNIKDLKNAYELFKSNEAINIMRNLKGKNPEEVLKHIILK